MEDCTTCKYNHPEPICYQGHTRKFMTYIENCHAWEEKIINGGCFVCDGRKPKPTGITICYQNMIEDWNIIYKNLLFCPQCGREIHK